MEHFKANLASYRVALLMPALIDGRGVKGTLRMERAGVKREFIVHEGALLNQCSNQPHEHLTQVLVDLKILDAQHAAAAYEAAESVGQALGTFLVERKFVELPLLLEALEHKVREAFFDCYTWESGELEFTPWPVERVRGVELRLKLGPLHRDAMARLREWRAFREVFPTADSTFQVYPEYAVDWSSEEDEALITLAERGASLGELLVSAAGGPVQGARRLLQLYRRGVLTPYEPTGPRLGDAADASQLLEMARQYLKGREFERAAAVAAQALEHAALPEAQAIYREAETHLALAIADEVAALEGRLTFEPLPHPTPANLTADDLYVYSKLRSARSVRLALRSAAMGELAAHRSVQRLMACGLVRMGLTLAPRRQTDPFGLRLVAP